METPSARGHTAAMYEVAFARVDDQCRDFEAASGQLTMRVFAGAALMPLFAVGLMHGGWPSRWFGLPYAVALVLFIVSGVVSLRALVIGFEDFRPHMLAFVTMPETFDSSVLERWVDGDALAAIERNDARLSTKRHAVRLVNALIVFQTVIFAATLAVRVFGS